MSTPTCTVQVDGVVCGGPADEEILDEYIDDVNEAWTDPRYKLTGNWACNDHLNMMPEI